MSKRKKGSGILVVVLSAITFSIYTSATYAEGQHFSIMQKRYERQIINYYEKDMKNLEDVYDELIQLNNITENEM